MTDVSVLQTLIDEAEGWFWFVDAHESLGQLMPFAELDAAEFTLTLHDDDIIAAADQEVVALTGISVYSGPKVIRSALKGYIGGTLGQKPEIAAESKRRVLVAFPP